MSLDNMNNSASSPKSPNHENLAPPSFQLPGLPTSISESLTSGTSIPPPEPSPPLPPEPQILTTPKKSSPRSHSYDDLSPTLSMPGAFPTSPLSSPNQLPKTSNGPLRSSYTVAAYSPTSPNASRVGTPNSKTEKRSGGLRGLLSFKSSGRSPQYGASDSSSQHLNSPRSENFRPASPGGSSLAASFRPSLGKKSGSFWNRRKSSLPPYSLPAFTEAPALKGHGQSTGVNGQDTLYEDEGAPKQNTDLGESPLTLRKRKSGTFWRRKSLLGLNGENEYMAQHGRNGDISGAENKDVNAFEEQEEDTRPRSPPPILPEIAVKDTELLGEDLFKNIG